MAVPIPPAVSENLEPHWHGQLQLVYARIGDATLVQKSWARAPLKIQRPFYPEGPGCCHSVLLHTAGGVVGGDRLSMAIYLHPQTQVLLTTAAAQKIYRSPGLESQQTTLIQVGEGSMVEWLPQETIVFDHAIYRQDLQVELEPKATWLGWEITRFGRSARGEQFLGGNWRSQTQIWQQGRPLWIDRQWLPGAAEIFHSPHGLASQPVVGSLAWVGQSVEPALVEQARQAWSGSSGTIGVTRLSSGLLCRYRGGSTLEARQWLIQVWNLIRRSIGGQPACLPRVWPI